MDVGADVKTAETPGEQSMKKALLVLLILAVVVVAAAWFEPTATLRGWARGDAFTGGRSATYWQRKLASEDPIDQAESPERLRKAGADAVPTLVQLLNASEPAVRWQAADILGKIGKDAASALPNLSA